VAVTLIVNWRSVSLHCTVPQRNVNHKLSQESGQIKASAKITIRALYCILDNYASDRIFVYLKPVKHESYEKAAAMNIPPP
jgi:hypothetical protein